MSLLPRQSPMLVPVNGIAAPAASISLKSTLVSDSPAAVKVYAVPRVTEYTRIRLIAEFPVIANVPVHVRGLSIRTEVVFIAPPVTVMLPNVPYNPEASAVIVLLSTSDIPFQFSPPIATESDPEPENVTDAVLAVIVILVIFEAVHAWDTALSWITLEPSVNVLVVVLP